MKDYLAHKKLADAIRQIKKDVEDGRRSRLDLLQKGRLSLAKLKKRLDYQGQLCLSSVIVSPLLHSAYRQLKFTVEKIPEDKFDLAVIEANYKSEIEEIRDFLGKNEKVKSKYQLAKANAKLYLKISKIPQRSTIYRLAGIKEGRPNYFYWKDEEIIQAASQFQSFAEMKYAACALHQHVKGRGLETEIVRANPAIAKHFYIGLDNEIYRSEPELVFGNLLKLNKIPHEKDVSVAGKVADFFFKNRNLYLEILQNDTGDRGSRRAAYKERAGKKRQIYKEQNLNVVFMNSDLYYCRGVLDVLGYLQQIKILLIKRGLDIGNLPPLQQLLYRKDEMKMRCMYEAPDKILPYLQSLGIDGVATLQNKFPHLHTILQYRDDFSGIMSALKNNSIAKRNERQRARHQKNREQYAPLSHAKEIARIHIISSQRQWFKFAKENRGLLIAEKIPSNVASAYSQRGEWKGWGDFFSMGKTDTP